MSKFCFLVLVALIFSLRTSVFSQQNSIEEIVLSKPGGFAALTSTYPNDLLGFDKYGIDITVEDYREAYKSYPYEDIKNQVELRLRQSKIKIDKKSKNRLMVNIMPTFYKSGKFNENYTYDIAARRPVTFEVDGISYIQFGVSVWDIGGYVPALSLREVVNESMDKFLLELLKSQEAHEKNKKELAAKNKTAPKPRSATPSKK
jgi:hypothetical protein